ncbi:TPA: hypothetical protein ACGZOX_005294, partial [Klebsiella pneumoniae]
LAECGSTTGQLCWSGAEGVQWCYAFDVKALKALPAATQQEGEAGRQRAGNRENAERKCGRRVSAARSSWRRRRAAFVAFWLKNGPSLRYKRAAFEISEEHHHVIVAADSDERVGHP